MSCPVTDRIIPGRLLSVPLGRNPFEQEQTDHRTLMEEITSAIEHIDPNAYYEYIEQPSLNRREKR